jgi:hypothetical protein
MTPKEKAQQLVEKFTNHTLCFNDKGSLSCGVWLENDKNCALIAVDEILIEHVSLDFCLSEQDERIAYWRDVKEEIEKL